MTSSLAPRGGCKIALCCANWNDSSNVMTWTWTKQYLLKYDPGFGNTNGNAGDHITVVHVGKGAQSGRWQVGGPLTGDLESCLERYPHAVVDLEGSIQGNIREFLEKEKIDIVVFGNRYPQSFMKALSLIPVREWVKTNIYTPYIIVRPEAVRNARMRFGTAEASGESMLSLASPRQGRRIAISYPNFLVGRALIDFVKFKLLHPADTVDLVHVFPASREGGDGNPMKEVMRGTLKLMRTMTLQRPEATDISEADTVNFGAAELEGFNVNLNVTLRGEAKSQLVKYVEQEHVDLLVIGARSRNVVQSTLAGASVSSHLIDHAICPVLVVPHAFLGIEEEDEAQESALSVTPASPTMLPLSGRQPPSLTVEPGVGTVPASFSAQQAAVSDVVTSLQMQVLERDHLIAELRSQIAALQKENDTLLRDRGA